mmetsp:Transcript_304/g.1297  ORF Transcript_304/g.1297 Transcript_304/m.1297 type:complete len:294 (-) Transcript_304:392-1273(-)
MSFRHQAGKESSEVRRTSQARRSSPFPLQRECVFHRAQHPPNNCDPALIRVHWRCEARYHPERSLHVLLKSWRSWELGLPLAILPEDPEPSLSQCPRGPWLGSSSDPTAAARSPSCPRTSSKAAARSARAAGPAADGADTGAGRTAPSGQPGRLCSRSRQGLAAAPAGPLCGCPVPRRLPPRRRPPRPRAGAGAGRWRAGDASASSSGAKPPPPRPRCKPQHCQRSARRAPRPARRRPPLHRPWAPPQRGWALPPAASARACAACAAPATAAAATAARRGSGPAGRGLAVPRR